MTYIVIALIVLGILEFVAIGLLVYWIYKIEDSIDSMKNQTELVVGLYKLDQEYIDDLGKKMIEFAEQVDHQTEIYKSICEMDIQICNQYKQMYDNYNTITEHYTKLLNSWKNIEERYSQSYEQFKLAASKLNEISYQITDLATMSTEDEYTLTLHEACDTVCLDCPYDDCWKDNCPLWHIKHGNNEPKADGDI